jgi:hypothetical protein
VPDFSTPLKFRIAPVCYLLTCLSRFRLSPGPQSRGSKASKAGKQQVHQCCPAFRHSHAASAPVVTVVAAAPPSTAAPALVVAAVSVSISIAATLVTIFNAECESKEGWRVVHNTGSRNRRLSVDYALTKRARRKTQKRRKNCERRKPSHRLHH